MQSVAAAAASASSQLRPCSAVLRAAGHRHPFRTCGARRHGGQAAAPAQQRQRRRVGAAEGEAATPESLTAVQELDALIDALLAKKGAQELAQAVAGRRHALGPTGCASPAQHAGHPQPFDRTLCFALMLIPSRLNLAENIMSFDQRFWLRLATRSDAAQDDEEKQQLAALAKVGGAWQ